MAILTYPQVVLADSPVVFLRLDEPSGTTAADSSGNGNDFTHVNTPTLDQDGPEGIGGKAVSYESNSGLTKRTGFSGLSYPFTMEVWAKPPSTTSTSELYGYFSVSDGSSAGNYALCGLRTDGSNDLYVRMEVWAGTPTVTTDVRIPNSLKGEWCHIVAVFNAQDDREIYCNGVKVGSSATSKAVDASAFTDIAVGGLSWSSNISREGECAEPAFYNSALSEERLRIHHAVGRGFTDDTGFEYAAMAQGPSIYYRMQETDGIPQDSSGWLRHATNEGSPTYGSNGRAIVYDGVDDASVLAADDLGITSYPATVMMMAKTPSSPANSTSFSRLMFGDDGVEDNFFGMELATDGGGTINARGLLETGGVADHVTGATALTADTFYLLTWRLVSATERYLYVDSAQDASDTDSRAFGSNIDDLVIGRDLAGSPSYIEGINAHVLVFPRDIGTTAISDLATKSSGIADAGQTFQHSLTDSISVQGILDELTTLSEGKTHSMITVPFDWGTPDGNLDITTTSAIGGDDFPIAAVFMYAGVAAAGISDSDSEISIGLFDGTNQVVLGGGERTGVDLGAGTTKAFTKFQDDSVMLEVDGRFGTVNRQASGVEFILNGVRINVPSDYGSTRKGFVTLFFDPGGQAEVGVYDPHDTQDSSVTVSPGFSVDGVVSIGSRSQIDNGASTYGDMLMSLGFAVNGGNQASLLRWSENGQASIQVTQARLQNNRGAMVDRSGPYIEYGTFTSTGFDATTRDAAAGANARIGYLALSMPNTSLHAGVLDTPTSVSDLDVETPAVPADGALFGTSGIETANSTTAGGSDDPTGYGWAVGSADDFGGMATIGAANVRQSPTETEEFFVTSLLSTAANDVHKVEATAFDTIPLGFRLGFGTVHTTAKKWIFLAAEGENINVYQKSIADAITVDDTVALAFQVAMADTISTADSIGSVWIKKMSDTVGLEDTIGALLTFVNAVSDQVSVADSVNNILTAIAQAEDIVSVSEVMAARGVFIRSMADSIETSITINVSGVEYVGLVLNTANMAISTYQGWDFNSFAEIDGYYIGAGREGVYELGGEDDDGTDIEWEIDLGNIDFGNSQDKRLPEIFYACRSDGTILFKVTHVKDDGAKVENWYQATRTSDSLTERRVKLKKGVKSQYYRVEIMGKDGSSADLEKIELTPMVLQRKL